ncbi:hypothetical protein L1887_62086 [Cichorium endivia]|nr:hypothetical protein L1887_62086 [Cichorium endivia]
MRGKRGIQRGPGSGIAKNKTKESSRASALCVSLGLLLGGLVVVLEVDLCVVLVILVVLGVKVVLVKVEVVGAGVEVDGAGPEVHDDGVADAAGDLLVGVLEEGGEERAGLKVVRIGAADGGLELAQVLVVRLPVDLRLLGRGLLEEVELVLQRVGAVDQAKLLDELVVREERVLAEREGDGGSTRVVEVALDVHVGEVRERLVVGIVNVHVGRHAVDQSLEPEVLDGRHDLGALLVERGLQLELVLDQLGVGLAEVLDERVDLLLKSVREGLGLGLAVSVGHFLEMGGGYGGRVGMRPRRDDGSEGGVGERPGALRSTDGCCGIHPFLPRSAKTKEKNLGCSYAQRHSSRRSVSVLRIAFATEPSGVLRCGAAPKRSEGGGSGASGNVLKRGDPLNATRSPWVRTERTRTSGRRMARRQVEAVLQTLRASGETGRLSVTLSRCGWGWKSRVRE